MRPVRQVRAELEAITISDLADLKREHRMLLAGACQALRWVTEQDEVPPTEFVVKVREAFAARRFV